MDPDMMDDDLFADLYGDDDATSKPSESTSTKPKEEEKPKAAESTVKPTQPSESEQTSSAPAGGASEVKAEAKEDEYDPNAPQDGQHQQQHDQNDQQDGNQQYDGQHQEWNQEDSYQPQGGNDGNQYQHQQQSSHHQQQGGQGYHQGGGSGSAILKEDGCVFSSIPSLFVFSSFASLHTSCLVKREDTGHSDLEHLSYPSSQEVHRGSLMGLVQWQERLRSIRMRYGKGTSRRLLAHCRMNGCITEGEGTLPWVFNILRTLRYNYLLLLLYLSCLHSYDSYSNPRIPHKEDLTAPSGKSEQSSKS
ncbi:hypothetical protein BJ508DRAFT_375847 [Ascobolus immersus RN42]|uniref:Uncharacterized protein n=1 Tax=Ascobolus immersus RN42 TaxID=1160509 RepID=A0A3N4IE20_ASCIM|nr:hypothetical protein BJ508DRAFT_375847 [Ascobolus immersus RN42]